MLQDLDFLAARIEQMVKLTRQLQADRTALQARVKALETERDQLGSQLQQRETELQAMAGNLADYEARIKAGQAQASQVQTQLQLELEQYRQRCSDTEQQLQKSQQATKQLSIVSEEARRQIDSILTRLPGPPQE
ncbi:MAG TPA: hypothetical protein VKZ71_08190 [Burkholderiaceae bacterium]|nr:hypothetical protein [Burkholderiaceae bacterium]